MRILILALTWFPVSATAAVNWGALLDQSGGSSIFFGAAIGGSDPFLRNADEPLAPASTAKVLTAAAVLARLGPDFRYPTTLRWNQNGATASGLELVGAGDPSWGMSELNDSLTGRLDELAAQLKAAGVSSVAGEPRARSLDPRWDRLTFPLGWKADDTTSCYGALGRSFNLDINCAVYRVSSPTSGSWQSPGLAFPVQLDIRSGTKTALSARLESGGRNTVRFVISGTWKSGPVSFTLPIYDTRPWIAALFRERLARQGITFLPASPLPPGRSEARSLTTHSPPLSTLLKPFLKNSINFMGDVFLKTLGAAATREESADLLDAGLDALRAYIEGLGLPRNFELYDGAGLSRTSRVSPRLLLEFLERQTRESHFPALWGALAVAGVDGTLSSRMKGTSAAGRLRGKTGTLDGVYNLVGYVPRGRDYVPFVVLSRTTTSRRTAARAAADRVGSRLAAIHAAEAPRLEAGVEELIPYVPEHAGLDAQ